jgi:hypothetical protein
VSAQAAAGPPDQVAQQQVATAVHGQLASSPRPAKRLRPEGRGALTACRSPVCCLQGQSCALCSCCEADMLCSGSDLLRCHKA